MTIDRCDLCNDPCVKWNIGNNSMEEIWRTLVAQALCAIASASGGGGAGSVANNIPAVEVAFGAITAAYVATTFLAADGVARSMAVFNNTNAVIQLSYGGVDAGPIIPPGLFRQIDFAANGRVLTTTDVFIKYVGAAPTLGSVTLDGFY